MRWFIRFDARFNTIVILLYRPSPQIPEPSGSAALRCVEAALYNIRLQREQIANKSVDLTWVFTQTLFMELNTVLWALSYPGVRKEKSRKEVEEYVQLAKDGIALASERWPGVASALELYENLTGACLKMYDGDAETSYVIGSPSSRPSRPPLPNDVTPPILSNSSTVASSSASRKAPVTAASSSFGSYVGSDQASDLPSLSPASPRELGVASSWQSDPLQDVEPRQPRFDYTAAYQNTPFDPKSFYNALPTVFPNPQHSDSEYSGAPFFTGNPAFYMPSHDEDFYLGTIGDQYSQYLHAPYTPHQPLQCLNQEQQIELMTNLEKNGLDKNNPQGYVKLELNSEYDP